MRFTPRGRKKGEAGLLSSTVPERRQSLDAGGQDLAVLPPADAESLQPRANGPEFVAMLPDDARHPVPPPNPPPRLTLLPPLQEGEDEPPPPPKGGGAAAASHPPLRFPTELVFAAQRGDAAALERLFAEASIDAMLVARRFLQGKPSDLVSDVAQSALVNAFRFLRTFEPHRGSFTTWLATIVRNEAWRYLRSEGRLRLLSLEELTLEDSDRLVAGDSDPLSPLTYHELVEALDRLDAFLTKAQRTGLRALRLELSADEAAELAEVRPSTARGQKSRARSRCQDAPELQPWLRGA